jgi:acetolactate synthase-1/3 small subunit
VLDVSAESVIAEISGSEADVDNFVAGVREFGIKELVRTGAVVMARGSGSIEEAVKR